MPKLINICGMGGSGTTMLDLMLGNGNDAFSCGEVYAWFRPWRSHHRSIVCSCGETPCPVWEQIKDSAENRFHSDVCRRLGVSFVIDSSKELRWLTDAQTWAVGPLCVELAHMEASRRNGLLSLEARSLAVGESN